MAVNYIWTVEQNLFFFTNFINRSTPFSIEQDGVFAKQGVLNAVRSITADFDKEVIAWKTGNRNNKKVSCLQMKTTHTWGSIKHHAYCF